MWSSWRDAFVGRRGLGDHLVEQRRRTRPAPAGRRARRCGSRRAAATTAGTCRRSASYSWLTLPSSSCGTTRAVIPQASFSRRRIGSDIDSGSLSAPPSVSARLLQLGIMVAVLLDIVAHPIFGRDQRAGVAVAGQARVAAGFLQRRVEPGDGVGDRRRIVGQLGQLVARHAEVAEQRVGENLGQLVGAGARAAARRRRRGRRRRRCSASFSSSAAVTGRWLRSRWLR